MNFQPNLRMDKATFLAWMKATERRYELAGGRVVAMPAPSRDHALLLTNLAIALSKRLDPHQSEIIMAFGVKRDRYVALS